MSEKRKDRDNNGGRDGKNYRHEDKRQRSSSRKVIEELTGTVAMTREGYGFIMIPDKEDDVFVPAKKMRGALHNDTVKVAVIRQKSATTKCEGEVIEVVERSKKPIIGILQIIGNQAWVIVESRSMPYDIKVPIEQVKKEYQGMKVAVLVEQWPRGEESPMGKIVDILGTPGENNTEMHAILAEFGLPYKFTEEVEANAAKIPIKIEEKEIKARKDFRNILTITIDPADAKDFDDAISFRKLENGNIEAGVHIADVTHYVCSDDIIDKEAIDRGTSVYLVDRTVPMLPEVLSNNLCSLRPNEEKLTFSAVFEMNEKGKIISSWFGRTVIKSDRRFAYEQVQEIIESNGEYTLDYKGEMSGKAETVRKKIAATKRKGERHSDKEVAQTVLELHRLATIMREKRFASGSISFERPEMKVIVDQNGKPIDIIQKISKEANWLVEEFMLLANKEVATYVTKGMQLKEPTFVYRIHDEPNFDKIQNLRDFIKHFGYTMGPTENSRQVAKELNTLLEKTKGKPENNAIEIIALRSMARARYSTDNVGHYGLGFDYYTHFTSPIRRYPDMMVHRLLAHYLDKGKSESKQKYEELCKHSSAREQLATEAERSSIKYKLTEFMQDKVGNVYEGTVSGVTEWGIYVEITSNHVEGMVMLRNIKEDFFVYDEKNYCVIGKSTRKKFTLGDVVTIKVTKANLEQKLIDFTLVWDESWNRSKEGSRESSRGRNHTGASRGSRSGQGYKDSKKEAPRSDTSRKERPKKQESSPAQEETKSKKTAFYEAVVGKAKASINKAKKTITRKKK
ncbi:MAG: RNB domain-containing ribonuclease [Bacteroidales bacterium]